MKLDKSYGVNSQTQLDNDIDFHLEELNIQGYTLLNNVLTDEELVSCRGKLDSIYEEQSSTISLDKLSKINEENLVRCPLKYDDFFLKIATNKRVLELVEKVLGSYFILHLQNGIINKPNQIHHQSSWHRDLPYQNFSISTPLALGALYCVDDYTEESGSTYMVPFSHKLEKAPSSAFIDKYGKQIIAKAGSVILFDSMLLHKAGINSADFIRRAINNVYTVPIIKQQINLESALDGKYADDSFLSNFLGYNSNVPSSDIAWRQNKLNKL